MAVSRKDVEACAAKALWRIMAGADSAKPSLAHLRRGVGRAPGELPQLWGEYLEDMPEAMYGDECGPSDAEWAVYTALTLYAVHQQGKDLSKEPMHVEGKSLGTSAAQLAKDDDEFKRVLRRVNTMATSGSVAELARHLHSLIQLLRADGIALDYVSLAGDIYAYQNVDWRGMVRLKWGRDFYAVRNKNKKEDENNGKE